MTNDISNCDDLQIKMAQGAKPGRRPAARAQGLPVDREGPALDAGGDGSSRRRRIRHLFDRGSGAAHLRPQNANSQARIHVSWWRKSSARSPRASPRRTPTSCSSPATTAAPAPRRSPASSTAACRGSSAWPTQQVLVMNRLRDRITVDGHQDGRGCGRCGAARRRGIRIRDGAAGRLRAAS